MYTYNLGHIHQLQDQHKKEIEEIRKAGHDALAVIVEEYKVMYTSPVDFGRAKRGPPFSAFILKVLQTMNLEPLQINPQI